MSAQVKITASNTVRYKDRTVKASIDPQLPIRQVIKQLTHAFKSPEAPITLALRDGTNGDELVTDGNLTMKVMQGVELRLVPSPQTEALDIIDTLSTTLHPHSPSPFSPLSPQTQHQQIYSPSQIQNQQAHSHRAPQPIPITTIPLSNPAHASVPTNSLSTHSGLKLSLFNLQKFIKEEEFAREFMVRGGMGMLVGLICAEQGESREGGRKRVEFEGVGEGEGEGDGRGMGRGEVLTGNSLAYALQGLSTIMDLNIGWEAFTPTFIRRLIHILATTKAHNLLRPSSEVLSKLISHTTSSKRLSTSSAHNSGATGDRRESAATTEDGEDGQGGEGGYGLNEVWGMLREEGECLGRVVRRIDSSDLEMASKSLILVNALLETALQEETESGDGEILKEIEALKANEFAARAMKTYDIPSPFIHPHLLHFQNLYLSLLRAKLNMPISTSASSFPTTSFIRDADYNTNIAHQTIIQLILDKANEVDLGMVGPVDRQLGGGLGERGGWDEEGLGLGGGDIEGVMVGGELGLELLAWFATHERDFKKTLDMVACIPEDQACPLALISGQCASLLVDFFDDVLKTKEGSQQYHPMLLAFNRLHSLVVRLFLRVWEASEATLEDIEQVSMATRHHLQNTLGKEANIAWHKLETACLETPYSEIRDSQFKEIDGEGSLYQAERILDLKDELHRQARAFMREQRLHCMRLGTWFHVGVLLTSIGASVPSSNAGLPWRCVALSDDAKTLAWKDAPNKEAAGLPFAKLPHQIHLSSITEVRPQTSHPITTSKQTIPSQISFSLFSGEQKSLLDVVAVDNETYIEWMDGLRVLFSEEGDFDDLGTAVEDAAGLAVPGGISGLKYAQILGDSTLVARIMDLHHHQILIPPERSGCLPDGPANSDFWYA